MDDRRSIVERLFARRREVDGFPCLRGNQEIDYPARRNPGGAHLSAILCKACWVALKGDVQGVRTLVPPGRVQVESWSQSGHLLHCTDLLADQAFLPRGEVTYHLGLLGFAEALAAPAAYADLLDALAEALAFRQDRGEDLSPSEPEFLRLMGHLSDELYYALRYGSSAPEADFDRLEGLAICDAAQAHQVIQDRVLAHRALTDPEALRALRTQTPEIEKPMAPDPSSVFRGWQLRELVETLDLGMNAILIGPTATGKSLAVFEARDRVKRRKPFFVIEGHESLKEFDLLGGYVPVGANTYQWRDGVVIRAMRAGGLLFCDEANRMPTRTLNILLGILSRRSVVLTEHGSEEVAAADGFQVILAMNLGRGYAVNALDAALVNRFDVTLEFRYLPPDQEIGLLVDLTALDRETAAIMVKVANETRQKRRNKELAGELTPRGLVAWARKLQSKSVRESKGLAAVLKAAARVTWVPSAAGTDADGYLRDEVVAELLVLIESHTPGR